MVSLKKMFIAEDQNDSSRHIPFITILITLVDIALLIFSIVYNGGLVSMSENPMAGPSALTLARIGAKFVPCMKPTEEANLHYTVECLPQMSSVNGTCTYEEYLLYICNADKLKGFPYQVYRFIIPIFFHGGIIHLIMNMFTQLIFGISLEIQYGTIRLLLVYLLSGIGGFVLSAIVFANSVSVGASGALFGLFAVRLLSTIRNWKNISKRRAGILSEAIICITWLIIGFFIPMIDAMGHLGGFLVGLLSGLLICPNLYWNISRNNNSVHSKLIFMVISIICLLAFFLGGFLGFFRTPAPVVLLM